MLLLAVEVNIIPDAELRRSCMLVMTEAVEFCVAKCEKVVSTSLTQMITHKNYVKVYGQFVGQVFIPTYRQLYSEVSAGGPGYILTLPGALCDMHVHKTVSGFMVRKNNVRCRSIPIEHWPYTAAKVAAVAASVAGIGLVGTGITLSPVPPDPDVPTVDVGDVTFSVDTESVWWG